MMSMSMSIAISSSSVDPWEVHKHTLEGLYLRENMTLAQVMARMAESHNFHEKKNQYEKYFKKWGWRKNLSSTVWKSVLPEVHKRNREGKEGEVFICGEKIPREKIDREMKRRRICYNNIEVSPPLSPSVVMRPLPSNRNTHLLLDLPFRVFENYLLNDPEDHLYVRLNNSFPMANSPPGPGPVITELFGIAALRLPNLKIQFLKAAVSPDMITSVNSETSIINPATRLYASALHRLVLFSLANNFAGLGALSMQDIVEYLRKETSLMLYEMIRSASDFYIARAIAHNLFRAAIELGDAEIVKFVLKDGLFSINVNGIICSVGVNSCTPLERASGLQHRDVVKVLLNHQANANLTYPKKGFRYNGALQHLVDFDHIHRLHRERLDLEIFRTLHDAGGRFSDMDSGLMSLEEFIIHYGNSESELVFHVIKAYSYFQRNHYSVLGDLDEIFTSLDPETSMRILKFLQRLGVDLSSQWPELVDIVAGKGHLEIVVFLLDAGVALTENALMHAIKSGNEHLVRFLLERGMNVHDIYEDREGYDRYTTPLATAMRLGPGGENIFKLIFEHHSWADGSDHSFYLLEKLHAALDIGNAQFLDFLKLSLLERQWTTSTLLRAFSMASDFGNAEFVEFLKSLIIKNRNYHPPIVWSVLEIALEIEHSELRYLIEPLLDGKDDPESLGKSLAVAIAAGQDRLAYTLISMGADTNCGGRVYDEYGPPLREALKKRNAPLVRSLLDADANPNFYVEVQEDFAITLAVEWGERSILVDLINAGIDLNGLPSLILSQGLSRVWKDPSLALNIAIERLDRELVGFLLANGADINHPLAQSQKKTALSAAVKTQDIEMVRFILHHGANPNDGNALVEAVEHSTEVLELLLDWHKSRYPRGHKTFGTKAFIRAIDTNNSIAFQKMIEKGLDATQLKLDNYSNHEKTSAFGHAIDLTKDRDFEFPRVFINPKNAENHPTKDGNFTFLEMILNSKNTRHHPEVVVSSLETTGGIVSRTTAFLAVIETGNISLVKLFIKHKADINFPPRIGVKRTPLQRAAEYGYTEIVQLLIDSGADVNNPAAERGGGTALQLTSMGGYLEIVSLLLSYGANVFAPASKVDGITALEGAAKYGRIDTVALLLQAGARNWDKDRAQFDKAMSAAKDEGFDYIYDMLQHFLDTGEAGTGLEKVDSLINWPSDDENAE